MVIAVIILFIVIAVIPSIGFSNYLDDTTPPITTISFNPPEPDGENGWYASNVTVILNATDDDSGVNITYYRVNSGVLQTYIEPFILVEDGEHILIEFYSIDNAGNQEEVKSTKIDIDQTPPDSCLIYEIVGGNWWRGWDYEFSLTGTDEMSNVNITYYRINSGEWVIYTEPFILSGDGDKILIEYYSVDYAGNVEDVKSATIPRTRATSNSWYHWFLERFLLLERLLRIQPHNSF